MTTPKADFVAILETLAAPEVDFIIVDGVAAVLQGAPVATFDLDVVHARDARNVESKEAAGREKDRAVLSILRRTLEERMKR